MSTSFFKLFQEYCKTYQSENQSIKKYLKNIYDYKKSGNKNLIYLSDSSFKKILYQCDINWYTKRDPTPLQLAEEEVSIFTLLETFWNYFPNIEDKLEGKYPLRLITQVNASCHITLIVENKTEISSKLFYTFFRIIYTLWKQRENNNGIDYDSVNKVSKMKISFTSKRAYNGYLMPTKLKLPKFISASVINPNNQDKYCLIYCLIISKLFLQLEHTYKGRADQFGKLEKFPEIQSLFNKNLKFFEELYDEDDVIDLCSEKIINRLEEIFKININIYTYLNKEDQSIERLRMSPLKQETDDIARILFVPYSVMEAKKVQSNVKEYNLDSKTKDDFFNEISRNDFFKTNNGHFVVLPNNSTLISGTTGSNQNNKYHLCNFCDYRFRSIDEMVKHMKACKKTRRDFSSEDLIKEYEPNKANSCITFKKVEALSKQPFICYADTETHTSNVGHKLFSYRLYMKHAYDPELDYHIERCAETEDDIGEKLCDKFMEDVHFLRNHHRKNVNQYRFYDRKEYKEFIKKNPKPTHCTWCNVEESEGNEIICHHDHNFKKNNIIGWICQKCNKQEAINNRKFSIVFHNLPYDLLVIIKSLAKKDYVIDNVPCEIDNTFKVIAKTSMKYSKLTINSIKVNDEFWLPEVHFIDSYAFVNMSLSSIINNMKNEQEINPEDADINQKPAYKMPIEEQKTIFKNTYKYIKEKYPKICEKIFPLSTEKGVIAYDFTNIESMNSKTNLPKECYRNSLDFSDDYLEQIAFTKKNQVEKYKDLVKKELDSTYEKSNIIFDILKEHWAEEMTYKKYFLFYLELDIFLLADFYEFFRTEMLEKYGLDPAHFQGLPGFSQNAMLLKTKKKLHLIPENVKLSQTIVQNLRGGFSGILNKISTNLTKSQYISGIDINNLYGYAMNQKLANKYKETITGDVFKKKKLDEENEAYFVECYYKIPKKFHDHLKHLPPLINHKIITYDELSDEQKSCKELKENYKSRKLCSTLENHLEGDPILLNYDNIKFYKRHGYQFKFIQVHIFEKEYVMRDYIEMNTKFRQNSTNEFGKNLYKLLNNIIYGKSIEDRSKLTENELLSKASIVHKRLLSPRLKSCSVIKDDELVFVNSQKKKIQYSTPIQVGFHILELSKLRIYSILYDVIIAFCKENNVEFKILLTDTDSLYIEYDFKDSNFKSYRDYMIAMDKKYPDNFDMHTFKGCDKTNKKKVGLFLDDYGDEDGTEITGLVGLAAKSYCYTLYRPNKVHKTKTIIKGKGVRNSYLLALYSLDDYESVAKNETKDETIKFKQFAKKNFENMLVSIEKKTISSFDDKFFHYQNEEGILSSLPYGHYKISEIKKKQNLEISKEEMIEEESD